MKLKYTRRFVSTALLGCSFKMESNIPNWTGKSSLLFILLHSIKTLIFPAKILAEDPEMGWAVGSINNIAGYKTNIKADLDLDCFHYWDPPHWQICEKNNPSVAEKR